MGLDQKFGVVFVRASGRKEDGGDIQNGSVVFNLPVGFRPSYIVCGPIGITHIDGSEQISANMVVYLDGSGRVFLPEDGSYISFQGLEG